MKIVKICVMVSMLLAFTSCNSNNTFNSEKIHVVTTTTMITDLVQIIGGDYTEVKGLMGPGVDPHLFQASPSNVDLMKEADIVVYNGLHLEGKMGEIFENLNKDHTVITVSQGIDEERLIQDDINFYNFDPHIWFDVELWELAGEEVARGLSEFDPENKQSYMDNLKNYYEELEELKQYIFNRIEEIPEEQRILVTAHDAFRYFGRAYGFQVVGLQGISTQSEAGTSDVSRLASLIADKKINAIFVESSVSPKSIESLQAAVAKKGFDVKIGGILYSDSLGVDEHSTYILSFKANIDMIIDALKGD